MLRKKEKFRNLQQPQDVLDVVIKAVPPLEWDDDMEEDLRTMYHFAKNLEEAAETSDGASVNPTDNNDDCADQIKREQDILSLHCTSVTVTRAKKHPSSHGMVLRSQKETTSDLGSPQKPALKTEASLPLNTPMKQREKEEMEEITVKPIPVSFHTPEVINRTEDMRNSTLRGCVATDAGNTIESNQQGLEDYVDHKYGALCNQLDHICKLAIRLGIFDMQDMGNIQERQIQSLVLTLLEVMLWGMDLNAEEHFGVEVTTVNGHPKLCATRKDRKTQETVGVIEYSDLLFYGNLQLTKKKCGAGDTKAEDATEDTTAHLAVALSATEMKVKLSGFLPQLLNQILGLEMIHDGTDNFDVSQLDASTCTVKVRGCLTNGLVGLFATHVATREDGTQVFHYQKCTENIFQRLAVLALQANHELQILSERKPVDKILGERGSEHTGRKDNSGGGGGGGGGGSKSHEREDELPKDPAPPGSQGSKPKDDEEDPSQRKSRGSRTTQHTKYKDVTVSAVAADDENTHTQLSSPGRGKQSNVSRRAFAQINHQTNGDQCSPQQARLCPNPRPLSPPKPRRRRIRGPMTMQEVLAQKCYSDQPVVVYRPITRKRTPIADWVEEVERFR